jgi:hypothetical protein
MVMIDSAASQPASGTQVLRGLGARDRAAVHAERKETGHKADQVVHLRHSFPNEIHQQKNKKLISSH